jgi:O-antigen/teichoic acid export membrane protein
MCLINWGLYTGQDVHLRLKQTLSWTTKGGFAVLDQGLFAGSNFILNILLARWLTPEEYGAFAVAFSIFLLLGALHTALLTEPMLVFGAGRFSDILNKYFAFLIYGHVGVTLTIGVLIFTIGYVVGLFYSYELQIALWGLACASPMILLLWLVRRAVYVKFKPHLAVVGGFIYLIFILSGLYFLYHNDLLTTFSALLLMGLSSLVVSFWFIRTIKPAWKLRDSNPTPKEIIHEQWKYSRWAVGTAVLIWIPGNIYYALLPAFVGLEGSAALKAIMNLLMPILHSISAVSILLVPLFSKTIRNGQIDLFKTQIKYALTLFIGWGSYILDYNRCI